MRLRRSGAIHPLFYYISPNGEAYPPTSGQLMIVPCLVGSSFVFLFSRCPLSFPRNLTITRSPLRRVCVASHSRCQGSKRAVLLPVSGFRSPANAKMRRSYFLRFFHPGVDPLRRFVCFCFSFASGGGCHAYKMSHAL